MSGYLLTSFELQFFSFWLCGYLQYPSSDVTPFVKNKLTSLISLLYIEVTTHLVLEQNSSFVSDLCRYSFYSDSTETIFRNKGGSMKPSFYFLIHYYNSVSFLFVFVSLSLHQLNYSSAFKWNWANLAKQKWKSLDEFGKNYFNSNKKTSI